MIIADRESHVSCPTCGQDAIRRTVEVRFPGKGGCNVSYDTHSRSLTESEWHAALNRLHTFYERAFVLKIALNSLSRPNLTVGMIESFDIDAIHPDACSRRTDIRVTVQVRAFGLVEVVKGDPQPLASTDPEIAIQEITPLAEQAALRLKAKFEAGRF